MAKWSQKNALVIGLVAVAFVIGIFVGGYFKIDLSRSGASPKGIATIPLTTRTTGLPLDLTQTSLSQGTIVVSLPSDLDMSGGYSFLVQATPLDSLGTIAVNGHPPVSLSDGFAVTPAAWWRGGANNITITRASRQGFVIDTVSLVKIIATVP